MKKTCLIHQQQGIGDLIFIQKIVKHYADAEFNVICPILIQHRVIQDHLATDQAHYPLISEQSTLLESFDFARDHIRLVSECETRFEDSQFSKPLETDDFVFLALGPAYKRLPADGLMLSKYRLAGLDYLGWQDTVAVKRNYAAEGKLWDHLGIQRGRKYTLINEFSSNGRIEIKVPGDAIYMRKIEGYSLFDWISVIERCSRLITVDTALVWLAELFLTSGTPAYLLSKWPTGEPSYGDFRPALRLPWNFTPHIEDLKL